MDLKVACIVPDLVLPHGTWPVTMRDNADEEEDDEKVFIKYPINDMVKNWTDDSHEHIKYRSLEFDALKH